MTMKSNMINNNNQWMLITISLLLVSVINGLSLSSTSSPIVNNLTTITIKLLDENIRNEKNDSSSQLKQLTNYCPTGFKETFIRTMGYKTNDQLLSKLSQLEMMKVNQSNQNYWSQCNHHCQSNPTCEAYFFNGNNYNCYLVNSSLAPVVNYNLQPNINWNYHRKICLPLREISSSQSSSSSSLSSSPSPLTNLSSSSSSSEPLPFSSCTVDWFFEKVPNSQLHGVTEKLLYHIKSEDDCLIACYTERQFICRSARYDHVKLICGLSRHDRRTSQESFRKVHPSSSNHHQTHSNSMSYLENQCVQEPPRCTFRRLDDYQVETSSTLVNLTGLTLVDCEKNCLSEKSFVCRSFIHYEDSGLCLLSPEDSMSLGENGIKDIKSLSSSASTKGVPMNLYEKASCIDVTISCEANEMTAMIKTSGPFKGRLFTLTHPQECYNLGAEESDNTIALSIPLHGGQCGTRNLGNGTYINSLVVQRHPLILRETDRRIDVVCDYQQITRKLRSGKQVSEGDAIAMTQVVTGLAPTPPIRLRVVNSTGNEVKGVELGDPLYLKVEMLDESVFGIFGSELVARSGEGSESVVLIDDQGCPVEPNVFPGLEKADRTSKALVAPFQAFRFATDPSVKFQMTVSFCLDTCPPVTCKSNLTTPTTNDPDNVNEYKLIGRTGRSDVSFGRRRRREVDRSEIDRVYGSPASPSDQAKSLESLDDVRSGDIYSDITMETTFYIVNNLKSDSSLDESAKLKHIRSLKHQSDPNQKRDIQILACNSTEVHFELLSGSMLAANGYKITRDLEPGVCLKLCLQDLSCLSVNIDYKKGTCSFNGQNLRTSGIDRNLRSSPFFNYFEKVCLVRSQGSSSSLLLNTTNTTTSSSSSSSGLPLSSSLCSNRDWSFERVRGKELVGLPFEKIVVEASTREQCELACLDYQPFNCLSAEFNYQMNECRLSPYNRFSSLNKQVRLEPSTSLVDYLENNCVQGPRSFCSWKSSKQNRLVLSDKTFTAPNVSTCQDECLNNRNFICRSFTFDSLSFTCSLSHHTRRSVPGAALLKTPSSIVNEISTCFDVSIDCGPDLMKAKVTSSTLFQGKLYARERPTSCFVDIANSMDFSLPIQLKGDECATEEESEGNFINTLIIQSNDHVITSVDKAIGVRCSYDVGNITGETVLNIDQLGLTDREQNSPSLPDLSFRIMDLKGLDKDTVNLGELLRVQVRMSDEDTYGIFVRNLIAKDSTGNNNLTLIDQTGCPVESKLMKEVRTIDKKSKSLESYFEAFSFTGSSTLELEADVETCLERCRPVQCQLASGRSEDDYDMVVSYGRKRRSIKSRNQSTGQPIDTKRMSKTLSIRASQFGLNGDTTSKLFDDGINIGKSYQVNGVLITRASSPSQINSIARKSQSTEYNHSGDSNGHQENDDNKETSSRSLALESDVDYDLTNNHSNGDVNHDNLANGNIIINGIAIEDDHSMVNSVAASAAVSADNIDDNDSATDDDVDDNNNHISDNGNDADEIDGDSLKSETGFNLFEPTTLATFMGIMIIVQTLLLIIGLIAASRLRESNQQLQLQQFQQHQVQHKLQSTDHFVSIYKS